MLYLATCIEVQVGNSVLTTFPLLYQSAMYMSLEHASSDDRAWTKNWVAQEWQGSDALRNTQKIILGFQDSWLSHSEEP